MTIQQQEVLFIEDLNYLDDWFSQYEYLLTLAAELPPIDPSKKIDSYRIPGCQSGVWLVLEHDSNQQVHVQLDSDSLILKGILALIVMLFDHRADDEILHFHPVFIQKTVLKDQLSTDRFQGVQSVIRIIQAYAAGAPWPSAKQEPEIGR